MDAHPERRRFRMVAPAFPAFNVYSGISKRTTAIGPLLIATIVSKLDAWDVEVIDENNYRKPGPRDDDGRADHRTLQAIRAADVVGLYGGLSSTIPRLYELARFYQERGVVTIAGGHHFVGGNIREALENGVDYVVRGEGEDTIRELLAVIREGGAPDAVAGIAFLRDGELVQTAERPPVTSFEDAPLPDFNLLHYAKIKVFPINWIRGCGMDCEFCAVKGKPRAMPIERVFEQIASLVETHNARRFFIVDDLFGHFRTETLKLCGMLADYQKAIRTRLSLTVQIRLDRARDAELLQAMRKAGVHMVCIGFESPIAEELKAMNKRTRPEEMVELTRRYHRAGFFVHGMFIFGYPLPDGVQLDLPAARRVRHFQRFIRKTRLDTLQVLLPVPLPGTKLTERLAENGRIFPREDIGWEYYDGNFPLFVPDAPLTPEEMQWSIRKIMGRFYRFRYMFNIGRNVLIFPAMMLSLWNIPYSWRKWYRIWETDLMRFGGWIVMRRWTSNLKHGGFMQNLSRAKRHIGAGRFSSGDHDGLAE
ncbi:B12-binding domain-containing radical SAM protein [Candidatus Sumerlaeota bacterium]|nr:B12-binding domain-containing radical SAM protein [Candidatus Sumerlaeota bacterium]